MSNSCFRWYPEKRKTQGLTVFPSPGPSAHVLGQLPWTCGSWPTSNANATPCRVGSFLAYSERTSMHCLSRIEFCTLASGCSLRNTLCSYISGHRELTLLNSSDPTGSHQAWGLCNHQRGPWLKPPDALTQPIPWIPGVLGELGGLSCPQAPLLEGPIWASLCEALISMHIYYSINHTHTHSDDVHRDELQGWPLPCS